MNDSEDKRPVIGVIIGDPCGIGPEVTVKALFSGKVHHIARPVLIGSAYAVEQALNVSGIRGKVRTIGSPSEYDDEAGVIDIIDTGALDPVEIVLGHDSLACGRASGLWLDEADALARQGLIDAVVVGPVSSTAMKMAGCLDRMIPGDVGSEYLVVFNGPLRVAHLTDHIPLARVCKIISTDLVLAALRMVDDTFRTWGIPSPRIGVCGLNPHAYGDEEETQIRPAVTLAQSEGIGAEGPVSPDLVFRQCIEGKYDVVLAMFHDQGHIALKTWGFSGNCATSIGKRPYISMGTAHGTAFDIVGRGVADHRMMLNAMLTAGSLAAGRGFPPEA